MNIFGERLSCTAFMRAKWTELSNKKVCLFVRLPGGGGGAGGVCAFFLSSWFVFFIVLVNSPYKEIHVHKSVTLPYFLYLTH